MPRYPVPDRARRLWCIAPDLNEDALARLKGLSPEDAFGYTPQRVALAECGVYDLADLARALPEELLSVPGVHPQAIPWWILVIRAALDGRRPPDRLPGEIPPTPLRRYRRRKLPPGFSEKSLWVSHLALAPVVRECLSRREITLATLCARIEAGALDDKFEPHILALIKALLIAEAEDAMADEPDGDAHYRLPFHVRPPEARSRLCGSLTASEQAFLDAFDIEHLRPLSVHRGRYGRWIDDTTLRAIGRLGLLTQLDLATLYSALADTRLTRDFMIGLHRILLDAADHGSGEAAYPRAA